MAERLAWGGPAGRLVVLKGGGGEAERNPAKPTQLHLWEGGTGRRDILAPALVHAPQTAGEPAIADLWHRRAEDPAIEARIIATIAVGLIATGRGGDQQAQAIWKQRPPST